MRVRAWDPSLWSSLRLHRSFSRLVPRAQRGHDKLNYNRSVFETDETDYSQFERVTAAQLATSKDVPKKVKMLVRDFIDDSLYNPHYGYFSKQAVIFSSKEPLDFTSVRDSRDLENHISTRYGEYRSDARGPGRQVWHTPTELFKVYLVHHAFLLWLICLRYVCYPLSFFLALVWPSHCPMYPLRVYAQELSL
jgi:hypothetical protein